MKWHKFYGVLFTLFDVTWVMAGRVADLLACWCSQRGNSSVTEVWRIARLCLMWIIWRELNAICFEDQERTLDVLKKLFIQTLFHWADAFNVSQFSTMPQFLSLCSSFGL
jgi:hypothetical protein